MNKLIKPDDITEQIIIGLKNLTRHHHIPYITNVWIEIKSGRTFIVEKNSNGSLDKYNVSSTPSAGCYDHVFDWWIDTYCIILL